MASSQIENIQAEHASLESLLEELGRYPPATSLFATTLDDGPLQAGHFLYDMVKSYALERWGDHGQDWNSMPAEGKTIWYKLLRLTRAFVDAQERNIADPSVFRIYEEIAPTARELSRWMELDSKQGTAVQVAEINRSAKGRKKPESKYKWLSEAMLQVKDNPDLLDAEIARRVEIDKSQLCRSVEYRIAAQMAREPKTMPAKGSITSDSKSGTHDVQGIAGEKRDRGLPIKGSRYFREYCAQCDEPIQVAQNAVGTNPVCNDCRR